MSPFELALGFAALGAIVASPKRVWGYVNGQPVELQLLQVGTDTKGRPLMLRTDAAGAWNAMKAAAAEAGIPLFLNSAFRDWDHQAELRAIYEAGGPPASSPGWSNHQGGTAVDVESASGTNDAFVWMSTNAARYGFKRTVPSEPWHWEFL